MKYNKQRIKKQQQHITTPTFYHRYRCYQAIALKDKHSEPTFFAPFLMLLKRCYPVKQPVCQHQVGVAHKKQEIKKIQIKKNILTY